MQAKAEVLSRCCLPLPHMEPVVCTSQSPWVACSYGTCTKKQIRMWDMAKQTNMSAVVGDIDLHIYLSLFLLQA